MSRYASSFVLGYHGCDAEVASRIVNGEAGLLPSDKDYDWLGPGAYFWESDPARAMEWATEARKRRRVSAPAVVGAVIDLGNCLDLLARENLDLVREAHDLFVDEQRESGLTIPKNKSLPNQPAELTLRYLDCAVIRFIHKLLDRTGAEPFDTVRGLFPEGGLLYDGAGFRDRNHIQIAVCNPEAIRGVFYPPGYFPGTAL